MDHAKIRQIGGYFGVVAVFVYVLGSVAAALQFPPPFNPTVNWISDMGNYDLNPSGAIYYNACAVIAGLMLVPFFIGIASWFYEALNNKYYYVGAEISGLAAALFMILHGIFQEGTSLHHLMANMCFLFLVLVLLLANIALMKNRKFNKLIGFYGFAAVVVSFVFLVLFMVTDNPPIILEWVSIYAGFLWVLLFSYNALSTEGKDYPVVKMTRERHQKM